MTQAQLHAAQFCLTDEGILGLIYQINKGEITCLLNEQQCLTVKKTKHSTSVILKEGQKRFKISMDVFETLCDLKQSVQFLASFLDGNTS